MVKIIRRRSIGTAKTYDIGVNKDHNFLLANGLFASNCFNKSHSTAYAYVTYQTAYLKANYPVEYMTALLSASSGNKDKVRKYRENAEKMGIVVLPPDINHSDLDFKPVGDRIRFGLSAVQNLGENAIHAILEARATGKFENLADLCSRLDLRVVNRRALETLVTCGAMDELHDNRHQMLKGLDLMINWAQQKAKEKASGQTNLFDMMGASAEDSDNTTFDEAPTFPKVADLTLEEKLRQEKELLGFYVSEHPLEKLRTTIAPILAPINLTAIGDHVKQKVSVVAILTDVKKIFTKAKNEPMAFVQFEDITGQVEGIVFPRTYPQVEQLLNIDRRVIVWGKVQQKEDRVQLIVDDLEPIEEVRMLMIPMSVAELNQSATQQRLKQILSQQAGEKKQGRVPVIVIAGHGGDRTFIRLGQEYWVEDDHQAFLALRQGGFKQTYRESLIPQVQAS
ncbi:OB-fold nucleic acid binding domain-containing protein [[Limnothrix rosea] IAM M-220]|uniref:helix-hairpin-helix domain-containing protein n=1 Tax=[Limnothrix rosea] IAM M-220 TaxID=454133 RepID=UPI000959DF43|nr:OB-fold nucleic acid binding domain-containing protein [[Limnothrix rosea] IAM M-220]OKH12488.1 DNA polymerase III subunit alpha [[Limnothrix rosea] IAM M-220]